MKPDLKRFARLAEITDVLWNTASQKLRDKAREEQQIQTHIDTLVREQRACADTLTQEEDPSQMLSAVQWMRWSDAERRRINLELARVRADLHRERHEARIAFGKRNAVDALQDKAAAVQRARKRLK